MKNKELLECFIEWNFNTQNFIIDWQSDYLVTLSDLNDDVISCITINSRIVTTLINGKKHLSYEPVFYNNEIIGWQVSHL